MSRDEDLFLSQIEPPVFLININDPIEVKERNQNVQEVEASSNRDYYRERGNPYNGHSYVYSDSRMPTMRQEMNYETLNRESERLHYHNKYFEMNNTSSNMYQQQNYPQRGRYEEEVYEQRVQERYKEKREASTPQEPEQTPEAFIDQISFEWRDVQVTKREKFLKEFMMKFLAYQVVEANNSRNPVDRAFWDWCFSLFPLNSSSSTRFKQYSDIWIAFLLFKRKFWLQFSKWYYNCHKHVLEEAKNDYLREKLKPCEKFLECLLQNTKGRSFQRTETLYVSFLTSMVKYGTNKEVMIDDIAIDIEKFDENDPDIATKQSKLKIPEK